MHLIPVNRLHRLIIGLGQFGSVERDMRQIALWMKLRRLTQCRLYLRNLTDARAEIMQRVEDALYKPDLVSFRIERPRAAQNDDLDLVDRVAIVVISLQPRIGLQIRVKAVLFGPLRARFVGEITLRHSHVVRAEDALAGTGKRLGQHRHRRDARTGPHRFQPQARQHFGVIRRQAMATGKRAVAADQLVAAVHMPDTPGVRPQYPVERARVQLRCGNDLPKYGNQRLAMAFQINTTLMTHETSGR